MQDIADRAGVHRSTVSLALRDHPRISAEVRARIQALARDLGYNLEHFWLGEPGMTGERFCDILTTRGIHGLIIGRLPPGQASMELAWGRFSVVALGMTLRSPLLRHVTENHFDTVHQAMSRCSERRYARVGFVFSEENDSPRVGDRWLGAYLVQQAQANGGVRLPHCPDVPTNETGFRAWFKKERPKTNRLPDTSRPRLRSRKGTCACASTPH
ncbi:MAG: LacI family DNA-binding transcriptional regulator [Opitutaceae bacterium]